MRNPILRAAVSVVALPASEKREQLAATISCGRGIVKGPAPLKSCGSDMIQNISLTAADSLSNAVEQLADRGEGSDRWPTVAA